jgi:hypothetical protein
MCIVVTVLTAVENFETYGLMVNKSKWHYSVKKDQLCDLKKVRGNNHLHNFLKFNLIPYAGSLFDRVARI